MLFISLWFNSLVFLILNSRREGPVIRPEEVDCTCGDRKAFSLYPHLSAFWGFMAQFPKFFSLFSALKPSIDLTAGVVQRPESSCLPVWRLHVLTVPYSRFSGFFSNAYVLVWLVILVCLWLFVCLCAWAQPLTWSQLHSHVWHRTSSVSAAASCIFSPFFFYKISNKLSSSASKHMQAYFEQEPCDPRSVNRSINLTRHSIPPDSVQLRRHISVEV